MTPLDQDLDLLKSCLAEGQDISKIKFASREISELAGSLIQHDARISATLKEQSRKIRTASVSLNKARLEKEQYKSSFNELQKILDLCRVISSSRDLKDILHQLLFLLSQILPSRGCAVFVGESMNGSAEISIGSAPILASNFTPALQQVLAQHFEEGIIRWILHERRVCLIPSFEADAGTGNIDGDFAVIPLTDNDNNYGFIWIACTIRQEDVTPENTNLIWVLSSHASIAIINGLHRQRMEEKFNELKLLGSINSLKGEILRQGVSREKIQVPDDEAQASGSLDEFFRQFHRMIRTELKVTRSFMLLDGTDLTEDPLALPILNSVPFLEHPETRRLMRLAEKEKVRMEAGDFFHGTYPQLSKALGVEGLAMLSLAPPEGRPAYLLILFTNEDLQRMPLLKNLLFAVASQARVLAENMDLYDSLLAANRNLTILQWQLVNSGKMAALGQLAGGVAHEINNPLQIMLGRIQMIQMMADEKTPSGQSTGSNPTVNSSQPKVKDELQLVTEEILRIRDIVRNLLDFSRQGKRETAFAPVSLNDTLREVLALLHHQFISNHVEVRLNLMQENVRVLGNKNQLKQVFINLIMNAIHAMEKEPRILSIETCQKGELFQASVTDSGTGMPTEIVSRIFEPFFSTKSSGTGLGLSISYGLIKEHKGTIDVVSHESQGTCFTIRLPKISEESLGYSLMVG